MLKTITWFTFCLLLCTSLLLAQHQPVQHKVITGDETEIADVVYSGIDIESIVIENQTIYGSSFTWDMHNMTDLATGYDLMSNASPQQLWYYHEDGSLNAVFTTSQQESGWSDRTCTYFYSNDGGVSWTNVGNVPDPGSASSGFPAVTGVSFGSVVIANHSQLGGAPTRTQLFLNSEPGVYDFVNFDPGPTPEGGAIWPKLGVSNNDNVVIGSSINGGSPPQYTNTFDANSGTFSGWQLIADGDQAETYRFATSANGKIGYAYLDPVGGAWFRESNDEGVSWSTPTQIYTPFEEVVEGETVLRATIRGIDIGYIGESPKVSFETCRQSTDLSGFFPGLPAFIYFWSPDVNGGDAFVIADENNVPFYPNQGIVTDGFVSVTRPVIGKVTGGGSDQALLVAFVAAGENVATTIDSSRFYDGYFMMSLDGGETWTTPEKFNPATTPPLDWRFVSIAPSYPIVDNQALVHLVIVGDPTAASQVNGAPPGVTAKFYHFSTVIPFLSAGNEFTINSFDLSQNYPNPFNPSTQIKYTLAERSNVTLKVYDVLGKEVATLVNSTKEAGAHEVNFDAGNLASGLYIYTIQAGSFTSSKKMMLLK